MKFELHYKNAIQLDAEDLAEGGIAQAYQALLDTLSGYIPQPAEVQDLIDKESPSYVVNCVDMHYVIYSPTLPNDEGQSWGRASHAFFKIINDHN